MPRLRVRTKARHQEYEIRIGRGILSQIGRIARNSLGHDAKRIGLISNERVFSFYGSAVVKSLKAAGFIVSLWRMSDGERHKSLRTAEKAIDFLVETKLERSDAALALGGGVVGDLTGFATAVYLRGIPFIQVPTTLLAQIDSSVGGKTGVNLPAGKNIVGSFHQPHAIVIDTETLNTLSSRELVAGWCEAVKQSVVASRNLFKQTTDFLKSHDSRQRIKSSSLEELIASHCAFKASIVTADEREDLARRDHRSRRILNFGHTVAHALEAVTNYRRFRHGEAVGHGMLVAGEISKNLGLLEQSELELLRQGVGLCGMLPAADDLDQGLIVAAMARDKKHQGGNIQWVLLERIGRPRLVDGKQISPGLVRHSLQQALRKQQARG